MEEQEEGEAEGGERNNSLRTQQRKIPHRKRVLEQSTQPSGIVFFLPSFQRSLCHELHRLMRVMWSGKWAVVTPHTVLNSVWRLIPSFHGYTQQDAQEFLWWVIHSSSIVHTHTHTHTHTLTSHMHTLTRAHSELLDRLQTELEDHWPLDYTVSLSSTFTDIVIPHEILPSLFQGRLASKVRRVPCVHTSIHRGNEMGGSYLVLY